MMPDTRPARGGSRAIKFGLLGITAFLLAAAIHTSLLIVRQQQALREVSRYSVTWGVSQATQEVARLQVAAATAAAVGAEAGEDDVQLRLDIVANRVQVFDTGDVAQFISTYPALGTIVATFREAVRAGQAVMDDPTQSRVERYRRLLALFGPLNAPLARLGSEANNRGADLVAEDQRQLGDLHLLSAAILGALTLCGIGLVGMLTWHNRLLFRAHEEVRSLVDDLRRTGEQLAIANEHARNAVEEAQLRNRILQERDRELHTQNTRFDAALNGMSQALCMADAEQRLIVCNVRFLQLFDLPAGAVRSGMLADDVFREVARIGRYDAAMVEALRARQQVLGAAGRPGAFFEEHPAGHALAVSHQPMSGGGWVATFEDITERRQVEARITYIAHHDALTNLPNRVLFHEHLVDALDQQRRRGDGLALLCLDLNRFKSVNDTLGHAAGDVLLEAVAGRLRQCVRNDDLIARLGGDEFAVLQSCAEQPRAAEMLAQRIVAELGQPFEIEGHRVTIGASVGIAIADTDVTQTELLKNADLALYRAKADDRGAYCLFESAMDAEVKARRTIETDLRQALERGELDVFYQPLFDVQGARISGFEALLRWRHPEHGLISPAQFIPVAEELGLIVPIGKWVLARACAEAATWPEDVKVAVNLSPVQFRSAGLVDAVRRALEGAGLAPQRLELEITETTLLQENEAVLTTLHELRAIGLRTALDDFGTGYSSLSYLRSFPFDKIKIDQSFVREMARRPDCLAIVNSVASLARKLGMTTTAEGVETEEQLAQLRDAGCTEVQGFLFDRPRPAPEIRQWFVPGQRWTVAA